MYFTPSLPHVLGISALLSGMMPLASAAQETDSEFTPEELTVEASIKPGANVFVNSASWDGASRIHVYGQENLAYKGLMSLGLTSQILLSNDSRRIFAFSDYMKRYTYGPVESVLQVFDVAGLTPVQEIVIPNKAAKAIGMTQLIETSADENYVYIQNATPATSVTVVDLASGEVVNEVPTPGCYGIYPTPQGYRFSTLCGDGTIKTYSPQDDGYEVASSEALFDIDNDALYLHAQRLEDGRLLFTSFNGNLYLADDSGDSVVFDEKIAVTEGIEGGWVPGGYLVSAYNAPNDMVFLLMHSDGAEGSHKDASEEIWAYRLSDRTLVSRSPAEHLVAIDVTQEERPHLYGSNEEDESVDAYALSGDEGFQFTKVASDDTVGWNTSLTVTP
ncbi:hypothetical protein GCM10027040_13350 [Halomonas shantousis]